MSLTTDFTSGVSAVHFDSRKPPQSGIQKEAEQHQKHLQAGNPVWLRCTPPTGENSITNPADFELPFYR